MLDSRLVVGQSSPVSFHVTNRMGEMFSSPDHDTIDRVLADLDEPLDDEHPDVALTHESGWSLGAFPYGSVTWDNVGDRDALGPRHLDAVSRSEDTEAIGWGVGLGCGIRVRSAHGLA